MRKMVLCLVPLVLVSFRLQDEGLKLALSADRSAVTFGEMLQVEVKLENSGDKDADVGELVLEERSVNFDISFEDRKSTRLNSSHIQKSRMPSSA